MKETLDKKGKKPGKRRSKIQVERDRVLVARWYCEGKIQAEIAEMLGFTQQQISYDLKKIRQAWLDSSIRDFDAAKAEQLAKIDHLEAEYWKAWRDSLQEHTSTTQQAKADKAGLPKVEGITMHTIPGLGDPRYLQGVERCIEMRCKLLDLYDLAATGAQGGGAGSVIVFLPDNGRGDRTPDMQGTQIIDVTTNTATARTPD